MWKNLPVNSSDIIIAALSALAGLGVLLQLPVWAIFIGWAWYIALGSRKEEIAGAGRTAVMAACLALSAVVLTDMLQTVVAPLTASMLSVFVTILLLMIFMKLPYFSSSLVAFNSFSCIFAGYYLGAFPAQADYLLNLGTALLWITGSNILGLFLGWLNASVIERIQHLPHKTPAPTESEI